MVKIYDKEGTVVLEGDDISLKIDKSRQLYVKRNEEKNFESIGHEVPLGLSLDDKKRYLYDLYRKIIARSNTQD